MIPWEILEEMSRVVGKGIMLVAVLALVVEQKPVQPYDKNRRNPLGVAAI